MSNSVANNKRGVDGQSSVNHTLPVLPSQPLAAHPCGTFNARVMSCSGACFAEESGEQGNTAGCCVFASVEGGVGDLGKAWCVRDGKPEPGERGLICESPSVLEKQSCDFFFPLRHLTVIPEVWVFLHIKQFCRSRWAPCSLMSDPRG